MNNWLELLERGDYEDWEDVVMDYGDEAIMEDSCEELVEAISYIFSVDTDLIWEQVESWQQAAIDCRAEENAEKRYFRSADL
jgi:hypothetical protein